MLHRYCSAFMHDTLLIWKLDRHGHHTLKSIIEISSGLLTPKLLAQSLTGWAVIRPT
jgi:hypothetical protein